MKNLKVMWPGIIAITVALSINSCHNAELKKEAEKPHFNVDTTKIIEYKTITEEDMPEITFVKEGNELVPVVEEKAGKTR